MAREIIWTDSAWQDLEETANYIAKDSRNYAAAFIREVRTAARALTQFSELGYQRALCPESSAHV